MDIGLIGSGRVARIHMCAYRHIPEAKVIAVSDINLEKANAFAQIHGIKKAFREFTKLLEMKNLDYVDICTPTSTHAKIACEAARFGHNILLEKPMARSTADCDKIIHEVSKHGVKLSICHNQLFIPLVMRVKSMVDSGEFPLIYFRVSVKENAEKIGVPSWIATAKEGGILWEVGCHCAYLQFHFLKDINEVFAFGDKIEKPVHDNIVALLHTPNHALGVIELSSLDKARDDVVFDLMSSNGKRIQIVGYDNLLIPEKRPRSLLQGFYLDQKKVVKKWFKSTMESLRKRALLACLYHYNLIGKFIQSLKDDSDPPVKPEDGRNTIKLLECIEESLDKNQPIKMEN